jgi:hypothetical protein
MTVVGDGVKPRPCPGGPAELPPPMVIESLRQCPQGRLS